MPRWWINDHGNEEASKENTDLGHQPEGEVGLKAPKPSERTRLALSASREVLAITHGTPNRSAIELVPRADPLDVLNEGSRAYDLQNHTSTLSYQATTPSVFFE